MGSGGLSGGLPSPPGWGIIGGMATTKKPKTTTELVVDVKPKRDPFFTNPGSIDEFCDYVAAGGHMAGFCRERGLKYNAVDYWICGSNSRMEMYARAKELRADVLADEIVSISDESTVETRYEGENVRLVLDATAVARNRLRVDARKWVASKLRPRIYGDKTTQEIVGDRGGPIQLASLDLKGLSDAELATLSALLAKAAPK